MVITSRFFKFFSYKCHSLWGVNVCYFNVRKNASCLRISIKDHGTVVKGFIHNQLHYSTLDSFFLDLSSVVYVG